MHIVMISDLETQGGAAVAASRLALGLAQSGERVTRIVAYPDGKRHPWATVSLFDSRLIRVIRRGWRFLDLQIPINANILNRFVINGRLRNILSELKPDFINVHNIHYAVSRPDLICVCAKSAPTVWTLHDMWSFTGRCPYNYDCGKFKTGCNSNCPSSLEYPRLPSLMIRGAWRQKRRLLSHHKAIVSVCPSKWLAREALTGFWADHRVECIPYGIPLDIYRPLNRSMAREALDLPSDGLVLLTIGTSLADRRKGGDLLVHALQLTKARPLTLLTMGHGELMVIKDGLQIFPMGYVDHERTKVLAYSAADILIHSARGDNLPNVVIESIACGTPVVGLPIGGIPDMVRPGETGWLADEASAESLAASLDIAIGELASGANYRQSCRAVAESDYSLELQARRYMGLFTTLREPNQTLHISEYV